MYGIYLYRPTKHFPTHLVGANSACPESGSRNLLLPLVESRSGLNLKCCYKQVCVIHEEYLQQMTETDMDALPSWFVNGFVFEATKFSDRTVPEQLERVVLEVTTDEIGLVLTGELLVMFSLFT